MRVEDPIGAGGLQYSLPSRRAIVMAAADKSPDHHAGRLGGRDAADTVLDHQRARRRGLHLRGRVEKEIRRRLAARDHLRGVEPVAEMRREAGERPARTRRGRDRSTRPHNAACCRFGQHRSRRPGIGCSDDREGLEHARLQAAGRSSGSGRPAIAIVLPTRPRCCVRETARAPRPELSCEAAIRPEPRTGSGSSTARCRRARRRNRR